MALQDFNPDEFDSQDFSPDEFSFNPDEFAKKRESPIKPKLASELVSSGLSKIGHGLGKTYNWATSSVFPSVTAPTTEEWMKDPSRSAKRELGVGLTSPLAFIGEALGGVGMLGKFGKLAPEISEIASEIKPSRISRIGESLRKPIIPEAELSKPVGPKFIPESERLTKIRGTPADFSPTASGQQLELERKALGHRIEERPPSITIKQPTRELVNDLKSNGYVPSGVSDEGYPIMKLSGKEEPALNRSIPEKTDYTSRVLEQAGKGTPGLSETIQPSKIPSLNNTKSITYRGLDGNPIATARLIQDSNGIWMVEDFAADKTKGLLYGRAVKSVGEKLQKMGVTTPAGTVTPDAMNLINKAKLIEQTPILSKLKEAEPLIEEQKAIYKKERGEKFAKAEATPITDEQSARQFMGQLAGEHTKVTFEPLVMEQGKVDELYKTIGEHPDTLDRIHAITGLDKIRQGNVPQLNELKTLYKVFGKDKIEGMFPVDEIKKSVSQDNISQQISKNADEIVKAPKEQKIGILRNIVDFNRTLITAFDFSAPGRQGLPLIGKKAYWQSFDDMFKSWGSQKAYDNVIQSIQDKPYFKSLVDEAGNKIPSLAEKSKLDLTDVLSNREELFRSRWAEKVPGVARSNRAYTAFLNKLRADTFENLVNKSKELGNDPETNIVLSKQIADFINTATGRGHLGALEKNTKILNDVFFAPKLMASRVKMYGQVFNPKFYTEIDPLVRKEHLKALFSVASTGLLLGEVARLGGARIENDPRSTDFRKIRIGNTRVDPFGGFQQYPVAAIKLLTGQSKSSTSQRTTDLTIGKFGQQTRASVISNFFKNKLAPIPSFVWAWMEGSEFDGTPFDVKKALLERTVPIVMQDMEELYKENPELLSLTIPSAFGIGVQTYGR